MAVICVLSDNGLKELGGLENKKAKAHEKATEKGDYLER